MVPLVEAIREAVPSPGVLRPPALIDAMAALHAAEAMLVERKLAVVAEFADHRIGEAAREEIYCGAEVAETEVGAALSVGRGEAGRLIELGSVLAHRLPRVRAALAAGRLDAYRAGLIASATRTVAAEHLAEVERLALDKILAPTGSEGVGLSGQRARNAIAAIIGRLDPAGVRERRRRAAGERYVGVSAAEDAMVHLFGALPAADGRKLDVRLRELANTPCPADGRTFDQRKADAVGALVDGLDFVPCACGREDCPQSAGDGPTAGTPTAGTPTAGKPTARKPTARKPLVHVILLGSTLNGEDEESGYLDGYGIIDADHARNLAADADIDYVRVPADVQYHRTHGTAPTPADTDTTPADPAATGERVDTDPADTAATGAAAADGVVGERTGTATDIDDAEVAGDATDPVDTGTGPSAHPGAATGANGAATGAGRPRLPGSAYVYRPNAILDAWLRILCGTCQWPHCDAPAWNADLDHDQPFNHHNPTRGGLTTARGMKAYCRTHHRIKHSGYWAERHNPDRSIDYIAPTGHRYHSAATGYLDLLGIDPDTITNPGPGGRRRRRRTRAENKAASIRAERRRQQTHIDLKKIRHTHTRRPPPDNPDDPCPF